MSNGNDLTQGPVWRALAQIAVPMVFAIIAVLSVSLVDTYFVGKLGTDALAAISFAFPVTLAVTSLSIGLGAGAASVVSRAIGGKNDKGAKRLSTDSLLLAVIIVILISILGYFTIEPLFSALGAKDEVLDLTADYMRIWYMSMPFLVIPMVASSILRATGDAFWPTVIMVIAAVVNIALTPLLIFGWNFIPAFGIEGAALGTACARVVTLFLALFIVIFKEKLVTATIPPLAELLKSWKSVLSVGLPAAAGSMVNPIGIAIVTAFLATFGDITVAAFGVATRLESFSVIPMLALSSAIGPVAGQNWGAANTARVISSLKWSYAFCVVWSVIIAIVFWLAASPLASLFASEKDVAEQAAIYFAIVPITMAGYGIIITAAAAYNSLGKAVTGLGFYLLRSAVFYVPLSWIAALYFDFEYVFHAIAISNVLAGIGAGFYSIYWLKKARKSDCSPRDDCTAASVA